MAGEVREKCAVAAIVSTDGETIASEMLYESLFAMQHRGPEASGMATHQADGSLKTHHRLGMVRDVYNQETIRELGGLSGIGHNRYSTSGSKLAHPQPFEDKAVGFAFSHNGNLPVTNYLETFLSKHHINPRHLNDSEMAGSAIAQYIRNGHDLPDATELAYPLFRGAFSCVAMHDGVTVAFRDPKGIRPLALGSFEGGYAVASETAGLDIIDANYEREIKPGEMAIITEEGVEYKELAEGQSKLDMFEFVYFARHDSNLYGQSVNEVRRRLGEQLAEQHAPLMDNNDNTIVIPVPDTSVPASEGYAEKLGLLQREAIIKNRYIGRTFIQPSNGMRRQNLRRKHNIIPEAMKGRDVVLVDDSIVRMNTLPRLVELAKAAGAKSVSALIASPPVRFPDYYGIDTPKQSELAAANMTVEQMREQIGCKYLGFLSLNRMVEATKMPAESFNLSCFTGEYPVGIGHHKAEIVSPVSMEYVD
ncbi:amidophosphoribosyltransferase [Candidatus Saccharibacteria bacterium]|nr:amidophosphoribosyltransferase [Candidatus Saccharibacteria bacterium]